MNVGSRMKGLVAVGAVVVGVATIGPAETMAGSGGIGPDGPKAEAEGGDQGGTFPVRGRHSYGDGLGAGRGHRGQDVLAKCGKPVVAATAGRVRVKDYQASGAGNFVVISGKRPRYDYVYMHMLGNVKVSEGQRVRAGETIGRVGTTGSSSACHLHFEMWTPPGWYAGGRVVDPTPSLKAWDRKS